MICTRCQKKHALLRHNDANTGPLVCWTCANALSGIVVTCPPPTPTMVTQTYKRGERRRG